MTVSPPLRHLLMTSSLVRKRKVCNIATDVIGLEYIPPTRLFILCSLGSLLLPHMTSTFVSLSVCMRFSLHAPSLLRSPPHFSCTPCSCLHSLRHPPSLVTSLIVTLFVRCHSLFLVSSCTTLIRRYTLLSIALDFTPVGRSLCVAGSLCVIP